MLGAIKSILQPPIARPSRILRIQSAPLPQQPSYLQSIASVTQRSRVGHLASRSPIRAPQLPQPASPALPRGQLSSHHAAPRTNHPASPWFTLSSFRAQGRPSPCRGPPLCSALQPGCLPTCTLRARAIAVADRQPSTPAPSVLPRAHTNPGSDKHSRPPREPTAVGQACFKFTGDAPKGWGMSPSYFAGPAGLPRDDIIDPDTRCLFGPLYTTSATNLCPQLLPWLRGAHGQPICPSLRDPFRCRMATHCLASYSSSSSSPAVPINHFPPRHGAGCYPGPQPCAPPSGGSGHVHVQALVETSHLEHRGLFRRCYCPGAAVFGHDHRPK